MLSAKCVGHPGGRTDTAHVLAVVTFVSHAGDEDCSVTNPGCAHPVGAMLKVALRHIPGGIGIYFFSYSVILVEGNL